MWTEACTGWHVAHASSWVVNGAMTQNRQYEYGWAESNNGDLCGEAGTESHRLCGCKAWTQLSDDTRSGEEVRTYGEDRCETELVMGRMFVPAHVVQDLKHRVQATRTWTSVSSSRLKWTDM